MHQKLLFFFNLFSFFFVFFFFGRGEGVRVRGRGREGGVHLCLCTPPVLIFFIRMKGEAFASSSFLFVNFLSFMSGVGRIKLN